MDVHFLPPDEIHRVHFYRLLTLVCLVVIVLILLMGVFSNPRTDLRDLLFLSAFIGVLCWRFVREWRWVDRCGPASLLGDSLLIASPSQPRQVPLHAVATVQARHCFLMTRRYRSFTEHVAIIEVHLHSGERLYSLAASRVLEFPAAKTTVQALQSAVLTAKVKNSSSPNPPA